MPGAVIEPVDVAAEWPKLASALSWDLFDATADVAVAGAIVGDGAGAGLTIVAAATAANPEVDLGVVIVGLALLIIAFAIAILLLRPLGWLLGHIPLVGGAIENALDNASNAVWNFVKGFVGNALHGLWGIVRMLWMATLGFPGAAGKAIRAIAGAANTVVTKLLPQLQSYLTGQDIAAEARARWREGQVESRSDAYSRQLQAQAIQRADAEYNQSLNYARALQQQETAYANALHADAVGHTNTLFGEATAQLHAEVQARRLAVAQAELQARAEVDQAERVAHSELATAVSTLTTLVAGTAATLTNEFTTGLEQTTSTLTGDINQVEQKLDNYLEKCGIPLCDNLSGLSNELANLLQVFDDVALLVLLAEIVHDPGGVADEAAAVVVPLAGDGASAVLAAI